MTSLNQGRNEIRFSNSSGKCLLENWVEERAVGEIDTTDKGKNFTSSAQSFKDGHTGLLTTDTNADQEKLTTVRVSYRPPQGPAVSQKGSKAAMLEKMLYEKVSQEVQNEFHPPPEATDFRSVTMADFNKTEFVSTPPAPTAKHDLEKEQPVTFWTEHANKVHGVSQVKTGDTPFKKNSAFSKPIEESMDQTQPYDIENYPKM